MALPAWLAVSAQVPPPLMVSWLPTTLQTLAMLPVEKVNIVSPLDALAVSVIGDAPMVTGEAGAKVTDCAIRVTGMRVALGRDAGAL